MAGLAYIETSLKKWDSKLHGDYKVRKIIFTCPRSMFMSFAEAKYLTWNTENVIFGIVQFPAQQRISKLARMQPSANFYRSLKCNCAELIKISNSDAELSDKDFVKQCVEYYLDYLQYHVN